MKLKIKLYGLAATLIDGSGEFYKLDDNFNKIIPPHRILIGKYATPDVALYFPMAAGAVFENGGIACHAAILAREFGIPCIMGVKGIFDYLNSSEIIFLNSSLGEVLIYENE